MFLVVALIIAALVFVGFAPTYWIPLVSADTTLSTAIHVHAALFFGWALLFVAQTALAHKQMLDVHKRVGSVGVLWSLGTIVAGFFLAFSTIARDLDAIDGTLNGVVTLIALSQVCMFAGFILLGVLHVSKPPSHKRFMTLAALVAVTPAIARISNAILGAPSVPVIFAASTGILLAVIWFDTTHNRRLHPVFLWGGITILAVRVIRIPVAMSPAWRSTAEAIGAWVG
ncbi:MAG: hypothetical protein O7C67_08770 [Gammaproteobacteria bacterium]|nr:hypothetical protein [Gammaproteobacteria bacterium]